MTQILHATPLAQTESPAGADRGLRDVARRAFLWSPEGGLRLAGQAPLALAVRLARDLRDQGGAALDAAGLRVGAVDCGPDDDADAIGAPGFALLAMDDAALLRAIHGAEGFARIRAETTRRLAALAPVAPLGEDRYALALNGDAAARAALLARLRRAVSSAPTPSGQAASGGLALVTLSAAICDLPADEDPADMVAAALRALPLAMAAGAEATTEARAGRGPDPAAEAMAALDDDRIVLAFQPIIRTDLPLFPAFHEALVRIRRADGELVAAGRFMPAIEAQGLARLFDRRVLELALARLARSPALRLSINVSARSIGDAQWMRRLEAAAIDAPGVPRRLIVELTESAAAARPADVKAFVARIRRLGCAFALDDFGAGATALGQLLDLRPDILKIDGALVRGAAQSPDRRAMLRAIAQMARQFETMTVAEFVTDEAAADAMARVGIDALQGEYAGMPTPAPVTLASARVAALSA